MFRVNGEELATSPRLARNKRSNPYWFMFRVWLLRDLPSWPNQASETDVPTPISIYGRSKFAGELALLEYAHEVPTTIVRPGIVYGPWNKEMLPIFQTIQRLRVHPVVGWRTPSLSFSYVDDTLEIMQRAAAFGSRIPAGRPTDRSRLCAGRGVYFAVSKEHPTYAELGRMIGQLMGYGQIKTLPLLGPAAWIAASANELMSRVRGHSDTFNRDKNSRSRGRILGLFA